MQVMFSVIRDLWFFVLDEFGFRKASVAVEKSEAVVTYGAATTVSQPLLLPGSNVSVDNVVEIEAPVESQEKISLTNTSTGTTLYTKYPDTSVHLRPGQALDTVIGVLSYAAPVSVLSRRDGWCQISSDKVDGWVEEIMLTIDASNVFPTFVESELYDAGHPETMKLRTFIKDEFSGGVSRSSLLSCEYVWYQLLRTGREFSWPLTRPRIAGRWADILQKVSSVHVGMVPLTGGVMEYVDKNDTAQLFYITAVRPDEAVVVSGILSFPQSVYSEQVITKSEWQVLKARFINKK